MDAVVTVESVQTFETRGGNTRYVVRDGDGRESTTFRPPTGDAARAFESKRARIEFHEQQRGEFVNVYLDEIEGVPQAEASGSDSDPEEAAWQTSVEAAPYLVGGRKRVDADELFEELKPFKDRVAEDIRASTDS